MGMGKKVLIADYLAEFVKPLFDQGLHDIPFIQAWFGAVAYTLQLYFDFSGYSDMAVGLGLLFNLHLPISFISPYKADSIIDFWRRWHITLSTFLKDYLYIPLGGNRNGELAKLRNLFITMVLGGLWHGAGWTFVLWEAAMVFSSSSIIYGAASRSTCKLAGANRDHALRHGCLGNLPFARPGYGREYLIGNGWIEWNRPSSKL